MESQHLNKDENETAGKRNCLSSSGAVAASDSATSNEPNKSFQMKTNGKNVEFARDKLMR